MPARRIFLVLCLVLSAVAVLPTGAGATDRRAPGLATHRVDNPRAAKAFWTRDRMLDAKPKPLLRVDADDLAGDGSVDAGKPFVVEGVGPTASSYASGEGSMTASSTGGLIPFERILIPDPGTSSAGEIPPYAKHGAIFFTSPISGQRFGCSGTAINSDNGSVVWTAGHCLFEQGRVAQQVVFVPGFEEDGSRPFGVWAAETITAPTRWKQGENLDYDFGAFSVQPDAEGRTLVEVVGGRGIAFNQNPTEVFQSFGYPGCCKAEFDGNHLYSCTSEGSGRLAAGAIAMGCDMEFGSSGGGWVIRNEYLASNVSGGDMKTWPNVALGPYLGDAARAVYDEVRGGTSEVPQPAPTGPVPPKTTHPMKITLRLRRHLVATGRVSATDGFANCAKTVPFVLAKYRKAANTYYPVGGLRFTKADGTFRVKLRDRAGRYLAAAVESPYDNSNNCAQAIRFARHRHG